MRVNADIAELSVMHPRLLWDDIGAALVAVLDERRLGRGLTRIELTTVDLPSYGGEQLTIALEMGHFEARRVSAVRRTYEAPRLIELAAIAVAAIGLYYAGGHEIRDVALRGSAADYLVDESNHLLEVAGRSRQNDFEMTWQRKWQRLSDEAGGSFYLCVVEFEKGTGKLAFQT